ncbi:NAD(P)/FAD-dependent oxidoreductase [Allonocardiopsis opalescens]|uniref:NADH dehydrogenase FAD-containing subunit n=1 Tax=Allonocardiopsis opalescens TaxID=1144618 RepID=A0A2T0Q5M7_9ACTN|nr:FAD-dependent oxidoreductase [Allonocardiopsis opalescens]PRX99115.1 NADH dehydrogenase FAD-containing subunit [Allonocardiopsis opalescens]
MRSNAVVIGGGYAGVMAANRLRRRPDVTVTLVNARPEFVERIRLHQLVGGSDDAVADYADLLAEGVRLVVGTAVRIDAAARTVVLSAEGAIGYDYLVYAVGSSGAAPAVPGAAEFAHPLGSLEDARRLRSALADTPVPAPVTVVGGGPTGIETAAELAEAGRNVTLVCGGILGPYLHPNGRRAVAKRLAELGVRVLQGDQAKVVAVAADAVELADGRRTPSGLTVWTAGFAVPALARDSGLATDASGRLLTDETLTSVTDDRIVAAGDAASPSGRPLRMSCQSAVPLGAQAADTVLSRIAGDEPAPVDTGFIGQCLSLGRQGGTFQFAHSDDTPLAFHVSGRLGAALKEFTCKSSVRHLRTEARKPGEYSWRKDGGRTARVLGDASAARA